MVVFLVAFLTFVWQTNRGSQHCLANSGNGTFSTVGADVVNVLSLCPGQCDVAATPVSSTEPSEARAAHVDSGELASQSSSPPHQLLQLEPSFKTLTQIRASFGCDVNAESVEFKGGIPAAAVQHFVNKLQDHLWTHTQLQTQAKLDGFKSDRGTDKIAFSRDEKDKRVFLLRPAKDLVLNFVGDVTTMKTLNSVWVCKFFDLDFYVRGDGYNVLERQPVVPAWLVQQLPAKGPKSSVVTMESHTCDCPMTFYYYQGATKQTAKVDVKVTSLRLPSDVNTTIHGPVQIVCPKAVNNMTTSVQKPKAAPKKNVAKNIEKKLKHLST